MHSTARSLFQGKVTELYRFLSKSSGTGDSSGEFGLENDRAVWLGGSCLENQQFYVYLPTLVTYSLCAIWHHYLLMLNDILFDKCKLVYHSLFI